MDNNSSSIGIIGIIILLALAYLIFHNFKIFMIILGIISLIAIILIIFLIRSSKKSKHSSSDIEKQLQTYLSQIRRQKFKAENQIRSLKTWANDAIYTTYSSLFGGKYRRDQLLENYETIKKEFGFQIDPTKYQKTDEIISGYLNHIEAEQVKIESLQKLQNEYEKLRESYKKIKQEQKQSAQLDKHVNRLKEVSNNIEGDKEIIAKNYTLDDLKSEIAEKAEYIKQLDQLNLQYGEKINLQHIKTYKEQLNDLKNKI